MLTTALPAPFESAEDVRSAHAGLLENLPEHPPPDDLERVVEFIRRAVATGAVLDAPEDRKQAQGLIDYWAASLQTEYRDAARVGEVARVKPPTTVLAEFNPAKIRAAATAADEWLAGLSEEDRNIARRLVLRLVRLRAAEPVFDLVPAARGALHYQGPSAERVDDLIRGLIKGGVVRRSPGQSPENDQIVLRSADLMTEWKALASWLDERLRFRAAVAEWDAERARADRAAVPRTIDRVDRWLTRTLSKLGRSINKRLGPALLWLRRRSGLMTPSDRLLSGEELESARAYHDRSPKEKQFIDESRARQQLASESNRVLMGAFALMFLAATVGWIFAGMSALFWRVEAREADEAAKAAAHSADEATRYAKAAARNSELLGVRRNQAIAQHRRLERTEDELAEVLELVLNNPGGLAEWRDSERGQRAKGPLKKIKERQKRLEDLLDTEKPLRPGCGVWINTANGGRTLCSVCCIVRLVGGADSRRFAVVVCSPLSRKGGGRLGVTRVKSEQRAGVKGRAGDEIGQLVDPKALHNDRPQGRGSEPIERDWIALTKLKEGAPANNELPTLKKALVKPPRSAPAKGDLVQLIGSSSGHRKGKLLKVEDSGLVSYTGEGGGRISTIGDGGGPVFNDRYELVAIHMTSKGNESEGLLIGGWLEEHGLELIPADEK
jgi:hypothetical protein